MLSKLREFSKGASFAYAAAMRRIEEGVEIVAQELSTERAKDFVCNEAHVFMVVRVFVGKPVRFVGDLLPGATIPMAPIDRTEFRETLKRFIRESIKPHITGDANVTYEFQIDEIGVASDLEVFQKAAAEMKAIGKAFAPTDEPLAFKPGSVSMVNISHDDWCGYFRGLECNCVPEIQQRVLRAEVAV